MNRTSVRRSFAGVAALALATTLAACGGAANENPAGGGNGATGGSESSLTGTIAGAGASSQQAAVEGWKAGFEGNHPGATVNYDPVGSGGGRTQFISGGVQFAGSDAYLKDEELAQLKCNGGEVIEAPVYISPIAVAYNLEGVDQLQLSPEVLAEIFNAKITTWNDPKIAADNPDATLPDTPITPVHRSDESGTTKNFTDYLGKAAPDAWPHGDVETWPIASGEAAKGTSGVVQAIGSGNGTIGYADYSQVGELKTVSVKVGEEYVPVSAEAASKVIDASKPVEGRPQFSYALDLARDTQEAGVYPIVLASYAMACTQYPDQATADLTKEWMTYIFSQEGQQAAAQAAGSAPISEQTREKAMAGIDTIKAAG